MQLILLERVEGLGNVGDEVNVRPGYGRNFLLPQGKAAVRDALFAGTGASGTCLVVI